MRRERGESLAQYRDRPMESPQRYAKTIFLSISRKIHLFYNKYDYRVLICLSWTEAPDKRIIDLCPCCAGELVRALLKAIMQTMMD